MLFEKNTIIANNQGNGAKAAGIAVVCWNRSEGLVFRNNVVTSNWGNVLLGDDYGTSDGYPRFVGNTFQQTGTDPDYRTIRGGYRYRPATAFFMGNSYEQGAAFESMELYWNATSSEADWYEGKVKKDVARGGPCRILVRDSGGNPIDGAMVTITDNIGEVILEEMTGANGEVQIDLAEYHITNRTIYEDPEKLTLDYIPGGGNKLEMNPYTVRVEKNSLLNTQSFSIYQVELVLEVQL